METATLSDTTAPTALLEIVPPATPESEPIRIAPDTQPTAPATPTTCKNENCGIVGPHPEPAEGTTCTVCEKTHGSTVSVIDRQSGKMVDRKVLVFHSGELVRDDQGLWQAQPTCTLCSADLKCATFAAQKAAKKGERKPLMPRFWVLQAVIDEAARRNAIDVEQAAKDEARQAQRQADLEARRERNAAIDSARERFQAEVAKRGRGFEGAVLRRFERNRAAGLNVAVDAELAAHAKLDALVGIYGSDARRTVFAHLTEVRCTLDEAIEAVGATLAEKARVTQRIDALVARGYHRTDAPRGNGRRPEPRREARGPLPEAPREPKAGERGGPRKERGDRHQAKGNRDSRGNPNLNGRGYVTPDDLE